MITELTANTTKQELFDYITTFLFKQGEPSVDGDGNCAYRGNGGLMCAFGCVIPDSIYHWRMENVLSQDVIRDGRAYHARHVDYFNALKTHENVIQSLQDAHDGAPHKGNLEQGPKNQDYRNRVRAYWIKEFARVARKYKLKFTTPL
jgi:hypothetical protein